MNLAARLTFPLAISCTCLGALALLGTGCSTASTETNARLLSPTVLTVRRVPPGTEWAYAECAATLHDGDFAVTGIGESMLPYYASGTALVVHPTSFFMLRPGMAVVYLNRHGAAVAHVLVECGPAGWLVEGLNNREPDDDVVTSRNLVGVVRYAFSASASRTGIAALSEPLAAQFPSAQ